MAQILMPLSVAATAKLSLTAWSGCKDGFMAGPWKKCSVVQLWGYRLDGAQRSQLVRLARRFVAGDPGAKPFEPVFLDVPGWLQLQHVLPDSVRVYAWVAIAFLALCLFNAAGVLAARFMRQRPEVGVRRALGASRRDVFAQHLFESGSLAVLGGLLALPLVYGALGLVHAQTLSYGAVIHFDAGTFVGLCFVTVITGLLVGIYPAWWASTRPPALQIKQN
jgi:putative ABC transport system permease protein